MDKNAKQLVSEYCQREHIDMPNYTCTPDPEMEHGGFYCTLLFGGHTFAIPTSAKTKKAAEMQAAQIACEQMDLAKVKSELMKEKAAATVQHATAAAAKVKVKDPSWITIDKVEDIYKYLTDEVLAQEFKSFLHCKAQEEKKLYPAFSVEVVDSKGYEGTVEYDGNSYKSIGIMLTKKQAEQSAAEVCLRSLGEFPQVEKEKYTIQVYRGGQINESKDTKQQKQKELASATKIPPMYRLLIQCVNNLILQSPMYVQKEDTTGDTPSYSAAVHFEGKTIYSPSPAASIAEAKNLVAIEALKYIGIPDATESRMLMDHFMIRRRRSYTPMFINASPFSFCPSKRTGWVYHHNEALDEMTGRSFTKADDKRGLIRIRSTPSQSVDELFSLAMKLTPCVDGKSVSECTDLSVCAVDGCKTLVGNARCSLPMYCEEGKIMSTKTGCQVDILPGHNVKGLKCSYQLMYPSLRVYLKAESCTEVSKPSKPLPVVASAGLAMLLYDHEANAQDLNILLTRPTSKLTFVSKARWLKSYLNSSHNDSAATPTSVAADPTATSEPTPTAPPLGKFTLRVADFLEGLNGWTSREVELLAEMSVDSMRQLLSLSVRYDERWNDQFAGDQLSDELKELKTAATNELSRRQAGSAEEVVEVEWSLPSATFQHQLQATGIHLENDVRCAYRCAIQTAGIKVKLSEIEEAPVVDLPCDDDKSAGNVCRYFVWRGIRKVSGNEHDPYYKLPTDITAEFGEGWVMPEVPPRASRAPRGAWHLSRGGGGHNNQKRKRHFNNRNDNGGPPKQKKNDTVETTTETTTTDTTTETATAETTTTTTTTTETTEGVEVDVSALNELPEAMDQEEEVPLPHKPGSVHYNQSVNYECRWFSLDEAKTVCPLLVKLSNETSFKNQVVALQLEANAFWKEKQGAEEPEAV